MALVNTLRRQVDLPVWEWARFAPAVSSAISCSCCADNSNFHPQHGRYLYYLIAATSFWRYDTWTDTYMQLSSPPIAPATWASMRFSGATGLEGLALGGGINTITVPAYSGQALKSFDIRIISGTGLGQRRIITAVAEGKKAARSIKMVVPSIHFDCTACGWAGSGCRRQLRDLGIPCAPTRAFGAGGAQGTADKSNWKGKK